MGAHTGRARVRDNQQQRYMTNGSERSLRNSYESRRVFNFTRSEVA